jgi:steroid delta-isomerase-like uncharacterized protein
MSTVQERNKELVRSYLAELDAGNRSILNEVYSPDIVLHFPGSRPMGFDALSEMVDSVYTAFPDFTHNIEDLLAEGDKVIARLTDVGTHLGDYQGIPPTGKQISMTAIAIMQIQDNQIVEVWEDLDMLGFLEQLGMEIKPTT